MMTFLYPGFILCFLDQKDKQSSLLNQIYLSK